MPELRKDPVLGRWVIIAVERARRPKSFTPPYSVPEDGQCPFCEGHESLTPSDILNKERRHKEE
ncbi:MAG TPA: galactose-1-phosphate uridylyltransferase, partial [Candidatus Omnitrophota bacterium]|nr:galactose-1-phosphate uridylyltransferase [Candidatus Omnitrophota bacterium]